MSNSNKPELVMPSLEHEIVYWAAVGGAFIILWWMTFFILLPIGMYDEDDPPGQFTPGAVPKPKAERTPPRLTIRTKMGLATIIAAALWCGFYSLVLTGVIRL